MANSAKNPIHSIEKCAIEAETSEVLRNSSKSRTLSEEDDEETSNFSSQSSQTKVGKIGVWMLVGLIFYSVSGGPLGSEIAVKAAGPAIALFGFLVMPLVWSLPEAAMTAELSIAYPEVFLLVCEINQLSVLLICKVLFVNAC